MVEYLGEVHIFESSTNGRKKVTIDGPSSLAAFRTQTVQDKDGTIALTSDITGTNETLDEVYDNSPSGNKKIAADDGVVEIEVPAASGNAALLLDQNDNQNALTITKDGTGAGAGISITDAGTGSSHSITKSGEGVALTISKTSTGISSAVDITNAGSGYGIRVKQTTGGGAPFVIVKTDTSAVNAAYIRQDGAADAVWIDQNANGRSIRIDSEATASAGITFQMLTDGTATKGDINFTNRTEAASSPDDGDISFDAGNDRLIFATTHKNVAVATNFGPGFGAAVDKTISSGSVSVTDGHLRLTSETGTTDQLATLAVTGSGPKEGDTILVRAASTHAITLLNGTGNLRLNGGHILLSTINDNAVLFYNGTNWVEISRVQSASA